jgi:hypothetical protein
VSDVFTEVDEAYRAEQLQKLWKRYGHYIVIAAVLLVAGIGGWRGYEWYEAKQAAEAGAEFEAAVLLAEANKHTEAEAAFAKIAAQGTPGYRGLAGLREAAELAEHDPKAAVAAYQKVAAEKAFGQVLQDLATLRAATLLADSGDLAKARELAEPLTGADRTFRHSARELLALTAWRAGDTAAAKRWFDMISSDAATPSATRTRVEMLSALVAAEGKS